MGRGTKMTDEQTAGVHALHKKKISLGSIAREVKKSATAVRNKLIQKNTPGGVKQEADRPNSLHSLTERF